MMPVLARCNLGLARGDFGSLPAAGRLSGPLGQRSLGCGTRSRVGKMSSYMNSDTELDRVALDPTHGTTPASEQH